MTGPASNGLRVSDQGTQLSFFFPDLLRYAGPGSPASLAMAYRAMRLSFPSSRAGSRWYAGTSGSKRPTGDRAPATASNW